MGIYIDPKEDSKEEWLTRNAVSGPSDRPPAWGLIPLELLPVCLIHNATFTAAGICYSEEELRRFCDPTDRRRRDWYLVPVSDLAVVQPALVDALEEEAERNQNIPFEIDEAF